MEERPWSEWGRARKPIGARQVATLLKPFGILSKTTRVGETTPKGYELADFHETFSRYLGFQSATPPQVSNGADLHEKSIRNRKDSVADEKSLNPASDKGCGGVADRKGEPAGNSFSGAREDAKNVVDWRRDV
jgi:hypothetical protein